jgi:hypothetical protein
MPRSAAEHLEYLYSLRDAVTEAMISGNMTKRWKLGSGDDAQEQEFADPVKALAAIEAQITQYESKVAASSGHSVSYARFVYP